MLSKADIERINDESQAFIAKSMKGEFINTKIEMPNPVRAYLLQDGDIFTINDTIIEHEYRDKVSVFYELKETTFFCPITRMYFTNQYRTGREFTKEELESLAYEKICNKLRNAIDKNSNSDS